MKAYWLPRMLAVWLLSPGIVTLAAAAACDDWPQWGGPRRDFTWNEPGILEAWPADGPKVLWRAPVHTGYTGPAVANGRVYLMDYVLREGNTTSDAGKRSELKGEERVACLEASTGKQLWEHSYDCPYRISYPAGPRCTPAVDGDLVFTLGAEGNLFCLSADDGKTVWQRDLKKDFGMAESPIWGFSAHPLVHGDFLYCVVGGTGSIAVAFNKSDGKEIWRSMSAKEPGYCPPSIWKVGDSEQLIVWHAEAINGLDPQTGAVLWSHPLAPMHGMAIAAPARDGDFLVASGLGVSTALQLQPADHSVKEIWTGKGFNSCHSPILAENGFVYGVDRSGWLRCIELQTGERKWQTTEPVTGARPANPGTAFLVKNGDRHWIAGETGELTLARLTPERYEKLGSAQLLEPTYDSFDHKVVWSCPAFANGCMYWRNDKELICVSLKAE